MLTFTAFNNDWITLTTSRSGRRHYETWAAEHPVLGEYRTAHDALLAAVPSNEHRDAILNAFLALSASEPLARHAIAIAFLPWMKRHVVTHRMAFTERDERRVVLIAAFIEAATVLAPRAPLPWPSTMVIAEATKPLDRYYRSVRRAPAPFGHPSDDLDGYQIVNPAVTGQTGPELVVKGLANAVRSGTISLSDANLVARLVGDGRSARQQAGDAFLCARAVQYRVRNVADRLRSDAA